MFFLTLSVTFGGKESKSTSIPRGTLDVPNSDCLVVCWSCSFDDTWVTCKSQNVQDSGDIFCESWFLVSFNGYNDSSQQHQAGEWLMQTRVKTFFLLTYILYFPPKGYRKEQRAGLLWWSCVVKKLWNFETILVFLLFETTVKFLKNTNWLLWLTFWLTSLSSF